MRIVRDAEVQVTPPVLPFPKAVNLGVFFLRSLRLLSKGNMEKDKKPIPLPQYPGEHIRRSGIYSKKLEELYFEEKATGCWLWVGTFNGNQHPIYKGWRYARNVIYDKYHGALKPEQHFRGQYCGNRSCVRPMHQIVLLKKEFRVKVLEAGTVATLLQLCERGKMLLPEGDRFSQMKELVAAELAIPAGIHPHGIFVEPSKAALDIYEWHKKFKKATEMLISYTNPDCKHRRTWEDIELCEECQRYSEKKRAEDTDKGEKDED